MFGLAPVWLCLLVRLFHSEQRLLIENLALRQQFAVFKRRNSRPKLIVADKIFWMFLRRFWSCWKAALIVVSPDTVVRWHRAGFQLYWRLISRARKPMGRRPVTQEIRELIFKMMAENPTWRAPRIHAELAMLGFDLAERSVSRCMRRAPRPPQSGQHWLTFLRNHREAIAAVDFCSVPTIRFSVLYVFFVISHDRRRILHINVTRQPTSEWIVQQLREAFPYQPSIKFLIFDHDAKYGTAVPAAIGSMEITVVRTAVGCPWQNGVAERWVGSCRRDLLDQVMAMNESHLRRRLSLYVNYYHQDRTHCGLEKQTRERRTRCAGGGRVIALPRLGGLHHRYERAA